MGRVFLSQSDATEYAPTAGETLTAIVAAKCQKADPPITCDEVALFNWGTKETPEVLRALVELVGCRKIDADPYKCELDPARGLKGKVYLPKLWEKKDLAYEKEHKAVVKQRLPATAVSITRLDAWFIPGKENCRIQYSTEGLAECAKKVKLEVYASNYCNPGAWNKSLGTFPDTADTTDTPVYTKDEQAAAPQRQTLDAAEWKGAVTTGDGALGKKTKRPDGSDEDRVINVAFSPYTVLLRYYLNDPDKDARILLEPFWTSFANDGRFLDDTGTAVDKVKIKWNVKGTAKFKADGGGVLLIWDKDGTVVFQRAMTGDELGEKAGGFHEFEWDGRYDLNAKKNSKNGAVAIADDMPYRVQIQMHTGIDKPEGLAVAVMHSEVRLYVHQDTTPLATDPYDWTKDKDSLLLACSQDLLYFKKVAKTDGRVWIKRQLALAGYHPGPVDDDAGKASYKSALLEFKRSVPQPKANPADDFKRFPPNLEDTTPTAPVTAADVQKALEDLTATETRLRPWFGLPADRSDLDVTSAHFNSLWLRDSTEELVLWVDDRHVYTDSGWMTVANAGAAGPGTRTAVISSDAAMGNYGDNYSISDTVNDKKSLDAVPWIPRPWIPLAVDMRLLGRDDTLASTFDAEPSADDLTLMRKAVGPLRVDWTFDEIDTVPAAESLVKTADYGTAVTRRAQHAAPLRRHEVGL